MTTKFYHAKGSRKGKGAAYGGLLNDSVSFCRRFHVLPVHTLDFSLLEDFETQCKS